MKAAWENGTFHLSQELIYTLVLFAFKKINQTLRELQDCQVKCSKVVPELHFSFHFRFYIQSLVT